MKQGVDHQLEPEHYRLLVYQDQVDFRMGDTAGLDSVFYRAFPLNFASERLFKSFSWLQEKVKPIVKPH